MKIVIDLDRALSEGKITAEESQRLRIVAAGQTSYLAANLLTGFGVLAVAAGLIALFASVAAVLAVGTLLALGGLAIALKGPARWRILGHTLLITGALLVGGGAIAEWEGKPGAFMVCVILFTCAGLATRSGLLIALAVLALSAAIGAKAAYWHATYALGIETPLLTIVVFTGLGMGLYSLSHRLTPPWRDLAIVATRTAVLLVNLGFWIGSLWGDETLRSIKVPSVVFALAWAVAILAAGTWAWRNERRWLLLTAAVFGGIHFFTQWFERLGATPGTVVLGGVIAAGAGLALREVLGRSPQPA